jgi:transcription elongation factor GreB
MSRYRPPSKPSSKYISAAGDQRLKEELHYLWKVERPKVTQAVSEAAALGDRSENAEYIYGKKRLREIDRRVRYLNKRLDEVTVVKRPPDDRSKVFFGATVELEDEQGHLVTYRLLEISLDTPSGQRHYCIVSITYELPCE